MNGADMDAHCISALNDADLSGWSNRVGSYLLRVDFENSEMRKREETVQMRWSLIELEYSKTTQEQWDNIFSL